MCVFVCMCVCGEREGGGNCSNSTNLLVSLLFLIIHLCIVNEIHFQSLTPSPKVTSPHTLQVQ